MTDLYSNPDLVRSLFFYKDGNLYWKKQTANNLKAGSKAGGLFDSGERSGSKRYKVGYDKKIYRMHRLIYLMHHNTLPKYIDHIDGNPLNNRIENLREATLSQNAWNMGLSKRNKSGVKGVLWDKSREKWLARCMTNGKDKHLGHFTDLEDAKMAVEKYRAEVHGEFARNK